MPVPSANPRERFGNAERFMWWFAVGVWQFCGSVSAFTVYGKWKRLSMRTNGTYGTHGTYVGIVLVLGSFGRSVPDLFRKKQS